MSNACILLTSHRKEYQKYIRTQSQSIKPSQELNSESKTKFPFRGKSLDLAIVVMQEYTCVFPRWSEASFPEGCVLEDTTSIKYRCPPHSWSAMANLTVTLRPYDYYCSATDLDRQISFPK